MLQIRGSSDYENKTMDNLEIYKMIETTLRFLNTNIPWIKNMASNLKQLAEKNEKYLNSQQGMQRDIEEYRYTVTVKNGTRN